MLAQRSGQRSELSYMIERACDPLLNRPDQSLNFEIKDFVLTKKANTPREAAVEVLRFVNDRRDNVSALGLELLDILVKNCGYPFHLQIATKDFLNELVRRFPERPPLRYPPWMGKILRLVHEWRNTICFTSKYKEDLVHIRDMHRLLGYKGYRFPEIDRRAESVLNPGDSLRTADELEEEDRAAQAAKLQELIRRGTPKDLAAAQELMKIMSGAEPGKQVDYEGQMRKELDKVQNRVLLLNEMLDNAKPGEKFAEGDTYDQIGAQCRKVQPKLQQWITEASVSDGETMDRLLLINDMTNQVIERYKAFKRGDFSVTAEINPALLPPEKAAAVKAAAVNLIDFDDPIDAPVAGGSSSSGGGGGGVSLDDALGSLEGLSLGPSPSASSSSGPPPGYGSQPFFNQPSTTVAPSNPMAAFNSTPSSAVAQNNGNRPASSFFDTLAGSSSSSSSTSTNFFNQTSSNFGSGSSSFSANPNPITPSATGGSGIVWPSHLQGGGAISLGSRPGSAASNRPAPGTPTSHAFGLGGNAATSSPQRYGSPATGGGVGFGTSASNGQTNGAQQQQQQQKEQQQQQQQQPQQAKKDDAFGDLLGLF